MRTLLLVLSLLPLRVLAQSGAAALPRFTLKTNLTTLISPIKQAYAFTSDIRLSPRMSVDAGAGAFFYSLEFAGREGESYKGPRLRAGLKYYLLQRERMAFHLGLEGKYQSVRHWQQREMFRQGQQYVEGRALLRSIKSHGVASRAGWQFYLGQRKRLLLEPYVGIGLVWHDVTFHLPPDAEVVDDRGPFSFQLETGKSTYPDILLGLHAGVVLW